MARPIERQWAINKLRNAVASSMPRDVINTLRGDAREKGCLEHDIKLAVRQGRKLRDAR